MESSKRARYKRETGRLMHLGPHERRLIMKQLATTPTELFALYKFGGVGGFREWCDAKDERGDNVWSHLLVELFSIPYSLSRAYETTRWLFFSAAFFRPSTAINELRFENDQDSDTYAVRLAVLRIAGRAVPRDHISLRWRITSENADKYATMMHHLHMRLSPHLKTITTAAHGVQESPFEIHQKYENEGKRGEMAIWSIFFPAALPDVLKLTLWAIAYYGICETGKAQREPLGEGSVLIECHACRDTAATQLCGGCQVVSYCSEECADTHWGQGGHWHECK